MQNIDNIISNHLGKRGPLLPILHDVQKQAGCISPEVEASIAKALNLTRAEVHGVVSFYHDFTSSPDARPVVEICRAESCKARGVEALIATAQEVAGARVKLKTVYCLGLCSVGPNARMGDNLHSRLDAQALSLLVRTA